MREDTPSRSHALLQSIRAILEEEIAFVNGRGPMPDWGRLLVLPGPHLKMELVSDAVRTRELPMIAVTLVSADGRQHVRLFDAADIVIMRGLELSGSKIKLLPSKKARYGYVAFGTENHALNRSLANTPACADTEFATEDHRNCGRLNLVSQFKIGMSSLKRPTRRTSRTRNDLIEHASELFGKLPRDECPPGLSVEAYANLLRLAFSISDAVHQKLLREMFLKEV